jgi:hypothetical protein
MRQLALTLLASLSACSAGAPPADDAQLDHWHQLEAKGKRLTATFRGSFWERRMLPVHNEFWPQITGLCAPKAKAAGIRQFSAVATISSSGEVTEYLINPEHPALKCFSEQMVGRKYPAPPETPFYEVYTVNLGSK